MIPGSHFNNNFLSVTPEEGAVSEYAVQRLN